MKKWILMVILSLVSLSIYGCTDKTTTTTDPYPDVVTRTYSVGTSTNNESLADLVEIYDDPTATNVQVLPVENLRDDFIYGVDITTVMDVYEQGGKYYDKDGIEKDLFVILKEAKINYVRIRLWVDPYNSQGQSYGGGTGDLPTALSIAIKAKSQGLGVCLDFHYSDFWADPSQQVTPKAWADLSFSDLVQTVYDYTYETLKIFEKYDALPEYVQIGNEINSGMLHDLGKITAQPSSWTRLADLISSGAAAAKAVSDDIQVIIHLANGATYQTFDNFFGHMADEDVDYDVIGLSYYSYWHGTIADFQDNMDRISAKYQKPVMVMEISYGFTTKDHIHSANIYNESLEDDGGYKTSIQGQASYLRDVIQAVSNVPNNMGLGAFYWEPAWLPVEGVGWATVASGRTDEEGKSSWANQALFSYTGKALPSLYIMDLIENATDDLDITILPDSVVTTLDVTLNVALNETLPTETVAIDSLHRYSKAVIVWNQSEIDAMSGPGNYVIHGTLESDSSIEIIANVQAVENYIVNPGLEERGSTGQEVIAPWYRDDDQGVKTNQTDARTGQGHVNVWYSADFDYDFYQDISLEAGTYELSFYAMGAAADQPTIYLYAANATTSVDLVVSDNCIVTSWPNYIEFSVSFTLTETTTVRIGVRGEGSGGDWAHFDDFLLIKSE